MCNQIVVGGLYYNTSPPFFRGVLPRVSRCIKSDMHPAAVLLLVKEDEDEEA